MSKGIWTKHLSIDGKAYFYNAGQNRSLWTPPPDSIVHEAINIRPPTYMELAGASSSYGKSSEVFNEGPGAVIVNPYLLSEDQQVNTAYAVQQPYYERSDAPSYSSSGGQNDYDHYLEDDNNFFPHRDHYPLQPQQENYPAVAPTLPDYSYFNQEGGSDVQRNNYQFQQPQEQHQQYHGDNFYQQPQQVPLVSVGELMNLATSSKQKQQNSKRFRSQNNEESDPNNQVSSYLKQKSEFEARAGNRDDESGKWLVR